MNPIGEEKPGIARGAMASFGDYCWDLDIIMRGWAGGATRSQEGPLIIGQGEPKNTGGSHAEP